MSNADVAPDEPQSRAGAVCHFAALIDRALNLAHDLWPLCQLVGEHGGEGQRVTQAAYCCFDMMGCALSYGDFEKLTRVEDAAQGALLGGGPGIARRAEV